ncbi:MAG: helix-turn-helix domain-containing protein [Hyphomicrobiaceae bacterium]|nr:helix-turn-helix domain-containing protein [Hyphomicrobiaceae bacterium]
MTKPAAEFHVEGLRGLSRNASKFLRRHPKEARMAVAAALEAAAAQYAVRDEAAGVPENLKPFVVARSHGAEMLGVSQAAVRLEVSRTTVYDWVEKKILLGWKSTKRGLTIPAEQILGPGKVVPGIGPILEVIGDPELTWAFLSEVWPFAKKVMRPIDKLKAGEVEEPLDAAPSFGAAIT